jgi:hypothetical protein
MKRQAFSWIVAAMAAVALSACAQTTEVEFVDHVKAGLIEQDVYVEKTAGSGEVYRINPDEFETYKDAPVYGTATVTHHAPFNASHNGPYAKGQALNMTLGEWLSGTGKATYVCKSGKGSIQASFSNLVPNGIYTMWYALAAKKHMGCEDCPFSTIDFPMGGGDGSSSIFTAGSDGGADYQASFEPCLEMSDDRLMAMLAIAYHSDGNTYGPGPGPMGLGSHVQLFVGLPDK